MRQTADGGYIVAGMAYSDDGDLDPDVIHGANDAWVVKYDANGNMQWQNPLGGSSSDIAFDITQTADGGYIMCGATASNNGDVSGHHGATGSSYDCWVVKLSGAGAIQWQKCLGGSTADIGYSIQQCVDGGYIIGGISNSINGDVTGNHGGVDYWVVKINGTGVLQWQKSLGGTGDDQAQAIQQTSDGGFVVAGRSGSNDGDVSGNHGGLHDYWVVKLDNVGAISWQTCYGGTYDDQARSIQQTNDGGYILTGSSESNNGDVSAHHGVAASADCWVVKINDTGVLQWEKSLGGTNGDYGASVRQTTDGGYVVGASTYSTDGDVTDHSVSYVNYDYWVVKLISSGAMSWQKCYGGTDLDQAYSIRETTGGGYVITGESYSGNFDVSGNHGQNDFWTVKLVSTAVSVQVKCFIEGYYLSAGTMRAVADPVGHPAVCDTVTLSLANVNSPYNILYTSTSVLSTSGNSTFDFPSAVSGGQYYLVVRHRNALETWSTLPVTITTGMSYDFTDAITKAFGSNMRNLGDGNFAIYSGDVNQDKAINMSDFLSVEGALSLVILGNPVNDLTGDGIVESTDYSLVETNLLTVSIQP